MKAISLKTRVAFFLVAVIAVIGITATYVFIRHEKKYIGKEITARGIAMSESLARVVGDGMAAEDLVLIKKMAQIVHTKDVVQAQVFTNMWLAMDAWPFKDLNDPPSPAAVSHFKNSTSTFFRKEGVNFDFYAPVFYDPLKTGKPITIGYVRLKLSSLPQKKEINRAALMGALILAAMTALSIIVLNALMGKFVVNPIMRLHKAVSSHKEGELPEPIHIRCNDEIGELSLEFNKMSAALREREDKLLDERERFSVTLKSIGDGVITTNNDGRVTFMNEAAERLTGWTGSEAAGRPVQDVFNIINEKTRFRCENPVEKVLASGQVVGLANHTALICKDATEKIIADSGAPIRNHDGDILGVVLVFSDITEKVRVQEQAHMEQKIESLGLLAAGIAHDFNNLLTVILGNISIAKFMAKDRADIFKRLDQAESAFGRARDLTQQLLTFAKGGSPLKKSADIRALVRESAEFVLSGSITRCTLDLPEDLNAVDVDEGQINQVLNNLLINAAQAMPDGGTITVICRNRHLQRPNPYGLAPGDYVRIVVSDMGPGIPAEIREKIFDPYFTTRPRGVGLGLAVSWSIVQKHGGHLCLGPEAGGGAEFHIYLPVSQLAPAPAQDAGEKIGPASGRILVMDDEELIRTSAASMLSGLGYQVEVAADGESAVSKFREAALAGRPFAAAILDLTVPGMVDGKEAATAVLEQFPEAKLIVSSGYCNDPVVAGFRQYGFRAALLKPYNLEQIALAVETALNDGKLPFTS